MPSRITPYQQLSIGQFRVGGQSSRMAELRDQISSGIRVRKPSDDPAAQKRILTASSTLSQLDARLSVINTAQSTLNVAHSQLLAAQQSIVHARDLALQSRQVTSSSEAEVLAQEIDGILESLGAVANAQHDGRYLFAGAAGQEKPFAGVAAESSYAGAAGTGSIALSETGRIAVWYAGEDVFTSGQSGSTLITGSTGAVGGSGTASGHGRSQLSVRHDLTTIGGASGVQTGLSSASGDTIIGTAGTHRLTIVDTSGNGSAGTVSLNGGPTIAFTSADQNLAVNGRFGEVVHLDLTTVTPGFNGTVDLAASGSFSLDGFQTSAAITFVDNQLLTDAAGNVRYLDSRGITKTGIDEVSLLGDVDVFETLRVFRDDLRNWSNTAATDWNAGVSRHLEALEKSGDQLLDVIGRQSVSLEQLDRLQERSEQLKLDSRTLLGELQSTDLPEAILQLQELQNQMEFTFATLSSASQTSVLDYL